MPSAILATKLFIPAVRPNVVARTRLTERLNAGLERKLTLISAPAGFGKSTLASAWVAGCGRPAAWLSLDAGDSDSIRFLNYLIAALQMVDASVGVGARAALESPSPPSLEATLSAVLNDVAALRDDFVLVFDDYHAVDARPIDDAVAFMLEHAPRQMHLVIVTREDPSLPLARLRGQNQLTELRASDLRFSSQEAAAFLGQAMGLHLSTADVAALEARTEGWITGLQLAALAVQGTLAAGGQDDASAFIASFGGSHRFVLDYLVEEVIKQQPERVQRFLIRTSLLDRLCGPLCASVLSGDVADAQDELDHLERANLLLVALDDRREWFRYHHLFAEALRARLAREGSDLRRELHQRASEWFARNALPHEAIGHALAAQDFSRAADLIEMEARPMLTHHEEATWRGWAQALPDPVVRVRPVLCVYFALALLPWAPDAADQRLREAERWLDRTRQGDDLAGAPAGAMVVADAAELRSAPGTLAVARAYHAGARGDATGMLQHAQRAVQVLPAQDTFWRGAATSLLGIASWANGDLEGAYASMSRGLADIRATGGIDSAIGAMYLMADVRLAQGRLHEAARICRAALAEVDAHAGPTPQGTADLHVILSDVHLAQGNAAEALEHLHAARALDDYTRLVEARHRWHVAMALFEHAQGHLDQALARLDEAERLHLGGPIPEARPIAALKAQVWIAQGRLDAAHAWARDRNLVIADEPSYAREFEHLTLARLVLAMNRLVLRRDAVRDALGLLERLLRPAEAGARIGSTVEILMLQALAHDALGDASAAGAAFRRALILAEPEGFAQIFVAAGRAVTRLLTEAAARGVAPDYTRRLLAALGAATPKGDAAEAANAHTALIEPLSERELEVLRLVAEGLSNLEIAQRLSVSLSTVKGHNLRSFGKLQVQRRTEAIARARELGLL